MPVLNAPSGAYFYVTKRGPSDTVPLILIHGAGSSHLTWPGELRRLKGRTVIALDLPGHGRSAKPGRRSILAYAESVREFMDELGTTQAILAGHSMGGAIAQTMALRMKRRVAGLMLMGSGARLPVNPVLLETALNNMQTMAGMLYKWMWGPDADENLKLLSTQQLLSTEPQIVHDDYMACDNFDVADQLTGIEAPTLILAGDKDKMTPPEFSKVLHQCIAGSQLKIIENAGHMLTLEKPEIVSSAVESWLHDHAL